MHCAAQAVALGLLRYRVTDVALVAAVAIISPRFHAASPASKRVSSLSGITGK